MTNGSLTNKKGLEEVLHAFSDVKVNQNISLFINTDFQNNITYKFFMFIKNLLKIILGKGDTLNYLRNLTNLANKINKQKNKFVKIVNYNRAELISLYQASDIFLFASKIEYSPLVIFEAMASQNAIISHDVGNVKEILEETKSGVLVNCEKNEDSFSIINTHDFAQKIEFLINNPEIIKKLSNQGRLYFSKKYNWRTIFKSYKDILLKN
jgi:glycosyltransferase involved in cell wall biosynthesis